MKILVIGKHGQLGAELVRAFMADTHVKVSAFGHEGLDICDYANVKKIIKNLRPDIVVNTSAYHVLRDCERYPQKAFDVNTFAVNHLAATCSKYNCKLVTYSTDYVFDGKKGKLYVENDHTNPLQMYGLSKLAGEIVCQNQNPGSIIIRTCGIYGGKGGSRQKGGNIVLTILKQLQEKRPVEVAADQTVNPTYAKDLAQATVKLLQKNPPRGIYHITNEGQCTWYEFAKEIAKLKKSKTRILPVQRGPEYDGIKRPMFSALANIKAKSLGVSLPSWPNGLKRYLAYITNK